MRATDLQVHLPLVDRDTSAVDAARLIAEGRLAGLVIADETGTAVAIVSAVDVLRLLIPGYVVEDMALAGVFDESGAEEVWSHAVDRKIGELVDDDKVHIHEILTIDADATLVEIAAEMTDARAQIAMVSASEHDAQPGFLTLPVVIEAILRFCAPGERATGE
jgi:CBS domain-containing protein